MTEPLIIASDGWRAAISPLGAELLSLTDPAAREYMTDADPRWWTGHAPILFPIVGALNGGTYRLGAREYALPKHGFARTSPFAIVEQGPDRVTFRLTDNAATRAAYPFAFALDMAFQLDGAALQMGATVTNRDDAPLPFSFGFHPAFAWPLPGGAAKDAHRVIFAHDEPESIRRIDGNGMLISAPQPTPVVSNILVPAAALFEADALIWDTLTSRTLSFGAAEGSTLDIAFPDCPNLGIWQKPGAPYLAIEPWHGYNDSADFTGDFRDKPGVIALPPGARHRFRMDVTVHPG